MSGLDALWKLLRTTVGVLFDLLTFFSTNPPNASGCRGGESVSAQAARAVCGAKEETAPSQRCCSFHPGPTLEIVRMARRSHGRETRYVDSLASERISDVLEMEVRIRRAAAGARRGSEADRGNGAGQSDLGRRTDRQRALVKDRGSDFTADGPALYAD